MSFRFFVSSAPRPTPQLLNSSTPQLSYSSPMFDAGTFCSLFELLKPVVRCSNVLPLVASAVTCILELRCSMYELSIFCLLCSTLSSPTPQLRCSMHGCSAPCFLCCHLDSSTHIVLLVSSAVTCTLELRCSMHELSVFRLLCSTLNPSTPQVRCSMHECSAACFVCCHLDTSTPQVSKSGVRYTNLESSTPVFNA